MVTKVEKLQKQIDALEKQKQAIASKEKMSVLRQINAQIALYGIASNELIFGSQAKSTPRLTASLGKSGTKTRKTTAGIKVPVKYRQGDNTWTGRGRQPKWLVDYLAQGGKLEELLVDSPALTSSEPSQS